MAYSLKLKAAEILKKKPAKGGSASGGKSYENLFPRPILINCIVKAKY